MATFYSTETRNKGDTPPRPVGNAALNQRERLFRATIPLDAPPLNSGTTGTVIATGDIISLFRVPAGVRFRQGSINASVSLGTTTLAIGVAGNPGKYRPAGTFTTPDTPVGFALAAVQALPESQADEEVIVTVAAANLPNTAGAKLIIDLVFTAP